MGASADIGAGMARDRPQRQHRTALSATISPGCPWCHHPVRVVETRRHVPRARRTTAQAVIGPRRTRSPGERLLGVARRTPCAAATRWKDPCRRDPGAKRGPRPQGSRAGYARRSDHGARRSPATAPRGTGPGVPTPAASRREPPRRRNGRRRGRRSSARRPRRASSRPRRAPRSSPLRRSPVRACSAAGSSAARPARWSCRAPDRNRSFRAARPGRTGDRRSTRSPRRGASGRPHRTPMRRRCAPAPRRAVR